MSVKGVEFLSVELLAIVIFFFFLDAKYPVYFMQLTKNYHSVTAHCSQDVDMWPACSVLRQILFNLKPLSFSFRFQKGQNVTFTNRPLHIVNNRSVRIIQELLTHLRTLALRSSMAKDFQLFGEFYWLKFIHVFCWKASH